MIVRSHAKRGNENWQLSILTRTAISEGDSPIFAARKSGQSPSYLFTAPCDLSRDISHTVWDYTLICGALHASCLAPRKGTPGCRIRVYPARSRLLFPGSWPVLPNCRIPGAVGFRLMSRGSGVSEPGGRSAAGRADRPSGPRNTFDTNSLGSSCRRGDDAARRGPILSGPYPSATSSVIIKANPSMAPIVAASVPSSPPWDSGMSSSTTT